MARGTTAGDAIFAAGVLAKFLNSDGIQHDGWHSKQSSGRDTDPQCTLEDVER